VSGKVNGTGSGERLMSDFYFSGVELKFQLLGFRAVVDYIWSVYSVEKCLRGNYFISLNVNASGQCFDLCW
jgi:hypothetical protein